MTPLDPTDPARRSYPRRRRARPGAAFEEASGPRRDAGDESDVAEPRLDEVTAEERQLPPEFEEWLLPLSAFEEPPLLEEGPVEELPYLDVEPVEDSRPDWVIWVESAEERAAAIVMAGERRQASLLAVAERLAVAAPAIAAGLAAVLAEGTTRYRLSVVAVAICAGALWTVVTRIVPWLRIDVVPVYRALGVELLLALAYAVVVTRVSSPAWRAVCLGLLIWALTYRGLVALLAAVAGVSWRLVRRRLWSMPDEALVDALRRVEMPFRRRGALPRELIVHLIRRLEEVAREYEIASTRAWRTRVPIVDVEVRRWVRSVIGMIRALQIGMALNAVSPEGVSTRLQTIMEAVATRDLAPGAELGRDKIWDNPPMFTNHLGGWVRGRRYLSRIGWALCAFATAVAGLTVLATSVWPAVPHEMVRAGWPWLGHVLTFDADVRIFTAGVGLSLLAVAQRTWSRARRW